jgi:hypothetical protein
MTILTVEGFVENGQIRLPESVTLPEHAKVYVVVPDVQSPHRASLPSPRLLHPEQASDFAKQVTEVLPDAQL